MVRLETETDEVGAPDATQPSPTESSPAERLLELIIPGVLIARALYAAATLGIADLVNERARDPRELAETTGTNPEALRRLLRMLASLGVFSEDGEGRFGLTPLAAPLRSDAPDSMRAVATFFGDEVHWRALGDVLHSIRTGESAVKHLYGVELFEYLSTNYAEAARFDEAMTSFSVVENPALAAVYDFSTVRTLVDVAGGHGTFLAEVMRRYPQMRGLLFDRPPVVAGALPILEAAGVASRCDVLGGDMFVGVPSGGDCYVLKSIIHDWGDRDALTILGSCYRAMPDGATLLLAEIVLPDDNAFHPGRLYDLEMLVVNPGGRERTERELRELLTQASFRIVKIHPTRLYMSLIEAVKA